MYCVTVGRVLAKVPWCVLIACQACLALPWVLWQHQTHQNMNKGSITLA